MASQLPDSGFKSPLYTMPRCGVPVCQLELILPHISGWLPDVWNAYSPQLLLKLLLYEVCSMGFVQSGNCVNEHNTLCVLPEAAWDRLCSLTSLSLQTQDSCLYHLPACFVTVAVKPTVLNMLGNESTTEPPTCWLLNSRY